jgi:hypothetical protein
VNGMPTVRSPNDGTRPASRSLFIRNSTLD